MTNTPDTPDQDEVNLCKSCNTMKHVDTNRLCGRCQPDQVDALDAAFDTIRKDGKPLIREAHISDAKAKLSALLVEAREQGALAHAESLTASGKQVDNPEEANHG